MDNLSFEKLALGTADIQAISGTEVSDYILRQAQAKYIFAQLFKEVIIPDGYRDIKTPRKPSATIIVTQNPGEGQSIAASSYGFNVNTISARKWGIKFEIANESLEASSRPLLVDLFEEASREWAKEQDLRAMTIALDIQSSTLTESAFSGGTLATSTLRPIIAITSATLNTGSINAVDYYDGKVRTSASITTGTVVFIYSNMAKNSSLYSEVSNIGTLKVNDILSLRGSLLLNSLNPDVILVNDVDVPNAVIDTVAAGVYLPVRAYTDKSELLNGEVGMIFDLKLLTSGLVPQGCGVMIDSERLGFNCIKRELEGIRDEEQGYDRTDYHLWGENDYSVSDTLAIGLITNFKTGVYTATNL